MPTIDVSIAVLDDMRKRRNIGLERYGKPVSPHSGDDWLQHAYEEALDLAVYLKAEILRRQECDQIEELRRFRKACESVLNFGAHHPQCKCVVRGQCDCGYEQCKSALAAPREPT